MNKIRLAAGMLAMCSMGAALPVMAQAAASDWTFTGNAGVHSDYRFRGISQTYEKPAFQGGFDVAHSSGFYLGNWNSNIDSEFFAGANLEMDFYGGYKGTAAGLGYDVGVLTYVYPGSKPKIDNTEIYVGSGFGPVSLKFFYPVTDFFGFDDSDGSWYLDASYAYDLGSGFGLVAHVGYQKLKGDARVTETNSTALRSSIVDYKFGVTYGLGGFVLGLSYIDTNRNLSFTRNDGRSKTISDGAAVLSLTKAF